MSLYNNKKWMAGKFLKGFTLIELLMVISIITLLSSMFFSYVGSAKAKSRDSVRLSDMKQIGTAANMYYEDHGEAPGSIEILAEGGKYLSAVPVDPKTGKSYKVSTATINGKKVFSVSATYESIYTTSSSSGEVVPQQVGIIVGDIDTSNICNIIADYERNVGPISMTFPNCDTSSETSNDQIIGVTSGHRRGGGGTIELPVDNISDCSVEQIDKSCPASMISNPCYCNDGNNNFIHNINISDTSIFTQEKCERLSKYGLYWMVNDYVCVDENACNNNYSSNNYRWLNGICYQMTEEEMGCYYNEGLWDDDDGCYKIIGGVRIPFQYDLAISCSLYNGVWFDTLFDLNNVCLKEENCEQYTQAPYHRYWSGSICAEANSRGTYLTQEGCVSDRNGVIGAWITFGSDYQCNVPMTQGQCSASGGDIWAGNVCKFSSTGSDIEVVN